MKQISRLLKAIFTLAILFYSNSVECRIINNTEIEILKVKSFDVVGIDNHSEIPETYILKLIPLDYKGPCVDGGDDCQVQTKYFMQTQKIYELDKSYLLTIGIDVLNKYIAKDDYIDQNNNLVSAGTEIITEVNPDCYNIPDMIIRIKSCNEYPELNNLLLEIKEQKTNKDGEIKIKIKL